MASEILEKDRELEQRKATQQEIKARRQKENSLNKELEEVQSVMAKTQESLAYADKVTKLWQDMTKELE